MTLKNKKLLVTGATGFIGANIVRRLLKEGCDVSIFTRRESDKWRISDILKKVSDYIVDLTDEASVAAAVKRIKPEVIVHTAVYGGYPFQEDVRKIFETNFTSVINLLNACKENGFELFLNTGSSSEYGIKDHPMKESDILEPVTDYGVSKASATLYCQAVAKIEKVPIATLRLFSPYGYFEDQSRLIPCVALSCLKGDVIRASSPHYIRDFIFIEDVVDAYIQAVEKRNAVIGEILNIGSGQEHSVGEVIEEVISLTAAKSRLEWGSISDPRPEPKKWQADISKAKKILQWQPRINFSDGLERTVEWFEQNLEAYSVFQKARL